MTDITGGTTPTIAFLDNPHSPDVFVDAAAGFFNFNGSIRITFESLRVNHATQAEAMARGLLDFINQQRTQQNPPDQATTRH
jgi:hypothetical protein